MIELSFEPDGQRGADWLELSCLLNYPKSISKPIVDTYFEVLNFEDPELLAADIFKHIDWRSRILSEYPFEIQHNSVHSNQSIENSFEYLFPLLLSTHYFYPEIKITNWSQVGDLFELFCTESIKQQIGNAILIGNPLGGLPTNFDNCIGAVCKIINEKKGPPHEKANDFQDAGVDIISWRKFDERRGQIVLLVQCASGKNWRKKGGDIKPKLWNQLIFWTVDPIKVLAFPYAFDFDSPSAIVDWIYYAYDGGLLLDRLRLANFNLEEGNISMDPIRKWVDGQLAEIDAYII